MVVKGKVVAGNDVYPRILLNLPVCLAQPFALGEKVVLRDFASPVRLCSFLEITIDAHAGETKDGAGFGISFGQL